MSRRMTVHTDEKGKIEVFEVRAKGGVWETEWEPIRGTQLASLFTEVSRETMQHALKGWTKPLAQALGLPPNGALLKLPMAARECGLRHGCAIHSPTDCHPTAKKMPWCFEPDGYSSVAGKAVQLWREGVYLVIVNE